MKRICTLLLAAGLVFGAATGASAIDFKAKGQWLMGFGVGEASPMDTYRNNGVKTKGNTEDNFQAAQRLRLQLDAVASEALSGTVFFEIGTTQWGQSSSGGALGADANNVIRLKRAYLDWAVPESDAKVRMGIQGVALPNVAGGSAVMDTDVAGITVNYKFNENVGLTALWARPLNDNFADGEHEGKQANYLDNLDLFSLMLPLTFDGVKVTPWAMYGMVGKNALKGAWNTKENSYDAIGTRDGNPKFTLRPYPGLTGADSVGKTGNAYGGAFWAGLPIALTLWDPLNIELDINYGYMQGMGRFDAVKNGVTKRSSTERQGWLAKALVEYKLDWGVPGLLGWYASGDDGNPKNGSERMPSIVPMGNFTSFLGDGNMGWVRQDYVVDYAGTWGIGAQIRDMSFLEDLSHTFRVAYFGGTNSTGMVKYMASSHAWATDYGNGAPSPYLTTKDGLLEFNLVNSYKIYENLEMNLELDYVANFMDNSTWKKANGGNAGSFSKQDMWKAQVVFAYSF
ncbi:MAG: outer membrane homotrimeric porin [Desulfovibrio sp.]|nr:outer membrane homotrimeric porin [Desulfovibrio sp.]